MDDGETDTDNQAEEPPGHRLLPPEDRVWRHPAEVAMEARESATRRRTHRRRSSVVVFGGVAAAAGLLWLAQVGSADGSVTTELISLGSGNDKALADLTAPSTLTASSIPAAPSTSLIEAFLPSDPPPSDIMLIRSSPGGEPLAGALRMRDGFVITSGRALAGAEEVLLTWGDQSATGVVVGYDATTDVSVIRVAGRTPAAVPVDARDVAAGDVLTLADPDAVQNTHTVVRAVSTSARVDGEPIVGIVELDGTLGSVPPGSPAFDAAGAVVGMITATADDAPAAVVPIDLVRVVADEIIELGAATHPRLGVRARNPIETDGVGETGSLVTALTIGGPAELGGVRVGDVIVEIDGESIDSMEAMVATLRSREPGDAVVVVVQRAGELVNCPVKLGSQLDATA